MQILLHGGRCSNIPLRTGQAYELQRTITFMLFHRPDLEAHQEESYRLVSDDGSFEVSLPVSSARPVGEEYSGLTAYGLPSGATFRIYRTAGVPPVERLQHDGLTYESLLGADNLSGPRSETNAAE